MDIFGIWNKLILTHCTYTRKMNHKPKQTWNLKWITNLTVNVTSRRKYTSCWGRKIFLRTHIHTHLQLLKISKSFLAQRLYKNNAGQDYAYRQNVCDNINESHNYNLQQKTSDTKENVIYYTSYEKFENKQNSPRVTEAWIL